MKLPLSFTAPIVPGFGRGKTIGSPTFNLDPLSVPRELTEGIYACFAEVDAKLFPAAMHYGPRPVFSAPPACEVHFLVPPPKTLPDQLTVSVRAYLREVRDFPNVAELQAQIAKDLDRARAILGVS